MSWPEEVANLETKIDMILQTKAKQLDLIVSLVDENKRLLERVARIDAKLEAIAELLQKS